MSIETKPTPTTEPGVDNGERWVIHRIEADDHDFHDQTGLDIPALCGDWGGVNSGKATSLLSSGGGYKVCKPCEAIARARGGS